MDNIPEGLKNAIRSKRLIPFVGSGVSMNVRKNGSGVPAFPSWKTLLERAAEKLRSEGQRDAAEDILSLVHLNTRPRLVDAAELARDRLRGNLWTTFLKDQLGFDHREIDDATLEVPRLLWKLNNQLIITTNHDRVLEWAKPDGVEIDVWNIQHVAELMQWQSQQSIPRHTLWHLHGCIDKVEDLILTPNGYTQLYNSKSDSVPNAETKRYEAALDALQHTIKTHTVLFVGFGFSGEERLHEQFKWLDNTYAGFGGPHYALLPANEAQQIRDLLADSNILVIGFDEYGASFRDTLAELASIAEGSTGTFSAHSSARQKQSEPRDEVERKDRVVAVVSGCGWWARNRTVLPYLLDNSHKLEMFAITNLVGDRRSRDSYFDANVPGGQEEFDDILDELNELNYRRSLPNSLPKSILTGLDPRFAAALRSCYEERDNNLMRRLTNYRRLRNAALDALYGLKDAYVPPKIRNPSYIPELADVPSESVKACIINTPNDQHVDLGELAIHKRLHVYAERPINPWQASLGDLVKAANSKGVLLYNGVQRRLEDTFRYIFQVVWNRIQFERLREIKIVLESGRRLSGWRVNGHQAGGGIVMDEGYHLLDAAAWVAFAADRTLELEHLAIEGSVNFDFDKSCALQPIIGAVETSAKGVVTLPNDVRISFDLSYHAPEHSVFELFQVRDFSGNVVKLIRDQPKRSSEPARIIHQSASGRTVTVDIAKELEIPVDNQRFQIPLCGISFAGGANNTGPLAQFIDNILDSRLVKKRFGTGNTFTGDDVTGIECDARLSVNTDTLVKAIYRLANKHRK